MPAKLRELSPAKINLFLKIINKRHDGYHNLRSGVTVINLFDEIIAEKSTEFYVNYIGEFAPKKNKFNDCIISKLFKEEMKNWINENLKKIIQIELNKFSDKIISEKLK